MRTAASAPRTKTGTPRRRTFRRRVFCANASQISTLGSSQRETAVTSTSATLGRWAHGKSCRIACCSWLSSTLPSLILTAAQRKRKSSVTGACTVPAGGAGPRTLQDAGQALHARLERRRGRHPRVFEHQQKATLILLHACQLAVAVRPPCGEGPRPAADGARRSSEASARPPAPLGQTHSSPCSSSAGPATGAPSMALAPRLKSVKHKSEAVHQPPAPRAILRCW